MSTGTVTFLFTDIEGSTRLLQQTAEGYAAILADHHRILRKAAAEQGGREIDNQGDSFLFAFERANAGVGAAVLAQRALAEHPWPEGAEVRVRMGVHTREPIVGEERDIGLGVHRAARIGAVAHGGQILLSNATRELLEEGLAGVSIRDLGSYRLRGLDPSERLYQLDVAGLTNDFSPLKAPRVEEPRAVSQAEVILGAEFLGYRIEEQIGKGGMGVVYRAYDLRLKRTVALKLVTPELAVDERFRERFARETELAMSLEHPNVVPIYDAGEVAGRLYLAMRLVTGSDLRAVLREEGPLEPSRARAICRQIGMPSTLHMPGRSCTGTSSHRTSFSIRPSTHTSPTSASRGGSRKKALSPPRVNRLAHPHTLRRSRSKERPSTFVPTSTRLGASCSSV
jgi:class 3 adenylate cyclase